MPLFEVVAWGVEAVKDKGNNDFSWQTETHFTRFLMNAEFRFCLSGSNFSVCLIKV